jgi:S1-C subfamily serine protease
MEIEPLKGHYAELASVQEMEEERLLRCENVVGAGLGLKIREGRETKEPCLTVLVAQKLPLELLREADRVPAKLDKWKTDVVETGEFFAGQFVNGGEAVQPFRDGARAALLREMPRTEEEEAIGIEALRTRRRPAQGGYSVGHYQITAGTIATGVVDVSPFPGIPARYYLLSNNHVLANSNAARVGDPILQPGPADGGLYPQDAIGRLSRFVTIRFGGVLNYVDAAVAEADFHNLDRSIFWVGVPRGIASANVGQTLQKTGRTTSWTTGRVTTINTTVDVNYGGGRVARFGRQIVTSNMSAPGDSGSLVLDMEGRAVGLLFAGSSQATILNPIGFVQSLLGVRIS